jgi:aminotransferase EvaB
VRIQVWDYRDELEAEYPEIMEAIGRVLRSGRLILGESVRSFEEEFAAYCGDRYGVGVNSGTDALTLALIALGVVPGDEVVTVANTAIPTVSAIVSAGATPRFVDIVPGTYLMDTSKLESALTPRTRCVIPVHLFGQCVDMDAVLAVAQRHGLRVLEDCAQCHGARFRGRIAGSMGDAAAFSFYPTKILGGYGDGGMVLTNSEAMAARLRRLRMYGTEKTYYSIEHGYNSRLDELHAEILRSKLRHLDEYILRRRELAARYDQKLAGSGLVLPETGPNNTHAFYLYVVRHPERDRILAELAHLDVLVNISYPWPVHTMPAYAHLGYKNGDLPHTEAAAKEIFSLPMYPGLTNHQQDVACERLLGLLADVPQVSA